MRDEHDQHDDDGDDDREPAPVVSLFAGEFERETAVEADDAAGDKPSVDDLFARLRAARSDTVAQRAQTEPDDTVAAPTLEAGAEPAAAPAPELTVVAEELAVFQASPEAPVVADELDDTPFGRRDAALTPIIVACARKLKRVLADEQNDVLATLRRNEPVRAIDTMLPWQAEQAERYNAAVRADLEAAALAGAASVDSGKQSVHKKDIARTQALRPAVDALTEAVVVPLRERLERAVSGSEGDNAQLGHAVRSIYREWKTQRIDEHLDDVVRMAFGRGALAALTPGTPVCWIVDPAGPACPDAEDNALAGVIGAGEQFPTDHVCAPAHEGCRCMLALAPR
jgi:hypothetical protein